MVLTLNRNSKDHNKSRRIRSSGFYYDLSIRSCQEHSCAYVAIG